MQTEEPRDESPREDRRDQRERRDAQRINIGGGDDSIARIQLAARWSEAFSPEDGDSLSSMLKRFRTAYDYLDAVTHGVEPVALEPEQPSAPAAASAPAQSEPAPPAPTEPQVEPRPW